MCEHKQVMKLAWVCFLIRDIKIEMKPSPRIYQGLNLTVNASILTTSCYRAADPVHSRSSPILHRELDSQLHFVPSWLVLIIIPRLAARQTGHSLLQNIFTSLPFSFLGPQLYFLDEVLFVFGMSVTSLGSDLLTLEMSII